MKGVVGESVEGHGKARRKAQMPTASERLIGAAAIAFSLAGATYSAYVMTLAVLSGVSPGRFGGSHLAGTVEYRAFLAACVIALVLMGALGCLGIRWARGGGRE